MITYLLIMKQIPTRNLKKNEWRLHEKEINDLERKSLIDITNELSDKVIR